MIITNLFKGPPMPTSFKGLIWVVSSTYTDIHQKIGKNSIWVNIPNHNSWIGFCLDGLDIKKNQIPESLPNNLDIGEINVSDLHKSQLHNALLKALIAQTIGISNINLNIKPAKNLSFFKRIYADLRFVILNKKGISYLFLRIDTKDTSRSLETDKGLLNTEERFNQIREFINHYWPNGIKFTFGGHEFEFESDFFKIGA
ncbi:hypothetical protein ES705_09911 [subsurface metagenome]